MTIIKIRIKEKSFKFLFLQFYKKKYVELYFDYLENRIYYKDKKKDIPTSKDLSRSIKMIFEMIKRVLSFNDKYEIVENNLYDFIVCTVNGQNESDVSKIIFGTQKFNLNRLINYLNALELYNDNIYALLNTVYKL